MEMPLAVLLLWAARFGRHRAEKGAAPRGTQAVCRVLIWLGKRKAVRGRGQGEISHRHRSGRLGVS